MDLHGQLDHLDAVLLSQVTTEFPDLLTDEDKATSHAYLLLAHAVLEEQLESIFEAHLDRLLGWLCADMVPLEVVRLAFAMPEWFPKSKTVTYKKRFLPGYMKQARDEFARLVRQNHGLSPDNVHDLAKLIGLDWDSFDTELTTHLMALKTLAVRRGEAGHLSPYTEKAVKLTRQDYPDNVREWVNGGRDAVLAVRSYLDRLMTQQQPDTLVIDRDGN